MASQPCDGCGKRVTIAGGIASLWSFSNEQTGGLDLELGDGSDWFLCYACIERLPDDREPTAEDVDALPPDEDRLDTDD